jgi:abortive infection alpha-like protein
VDGENGSVLRRAARLVGEVLVRPVTNNGSGRPAEPLRAAMEALLDSSADADREQAAEELYSAVLRQLTADEARILAVLGTGAVFPVVDVVSREVTLLRNASTVGEAAGVTLRDEVPSYLSRLAGLGLIEREGERADLASQYEILATDALVRAAGSTARRVRLVRGTVRISRFGARFWAACDPLKGRTL